MNSNLKYDEKYLYNKIYELKNLKTIKTNELINNYVIYFVLFVKKIIEKNEKNKILTEISKEKKRKELIKENIVKIKDKLKVGKNGLTLKEIQYNKNSEENKLFEKEKNKIEYEENSEDNRSDDKCNFVKICNDLNSAFHICILLLVNNIKNNEEELFHKKSYDKNSYCRERSYEDLDKIDNTQIMEQQEKKKEDENLNRINKNNLFFQLNLLYISLCFYNMYLLNDNNYYLNFSLFLFLNNFHYFKNKEIIHYICIENVYVKYEISVPKFLFDICNTIGIIYKKQKDIYTSIFFFTYSFFFLKYIKKDDKDMNKDKKEIQKINVLQNLNEIFLEFNFFSISTYFILKTIDLHLIFLKNSIENIEREKKEIELEKEKNIKINDDTNKREIKNKSEIIEGYSINENNILHCSNNYNKDNINYHLDNEYNSNIIREKDIYFDEKLKNIMDTYISLYNNINECSYIFLDMHLLSIYEHLNFVIFYMTKDVYNLFHILKREKEKKILFEYKYMTYRNLLEIYIIYLKYNYLNYSQNDYNLDIYKNVHHIYENNEKIENLFHSLLRKNNFYLDDQKKKKKNVNSVNNNEIISCENLDSIFTINNNFNKMITDYSENKEIANNKIINTDKKYIKECFDDKKIFICDNNNNIEKNVIYLDNEISIDTANVCYEETKKKLFLQTKRNNFHDFSIYDNNIIYSFIFQHILKENKLNFDNKEEENIFFVNNAYEKMSFLKFFQDTLKDMDELVEQIFILMIKQNTSIKIEIDVDCFEEFIKIFQFNNINLANMNIKFCNFSNSIYNNLAIHKIKKIYKSFSKYRNNKEYISFLLSKNKKEENLTKFLKYIHYFCYNYDEILFLFKNIKKYKKRSFEYFSLFDQTTFHLDILLNSSESYFYFNFFIKSFNLYIKNYLEIINSLTYPINYIENKQYLFYKRELILKCALLLKDVYICKKLNTFNENIYFNTINQKKNLNFDDNLSGILSLEQKKTIMQIMKYYFSFLNTYEKDDKTNEIIFENEEEKKSYFDIYFYVCKTLSSVDDKIFISNSIQQYKYLLNYSLKYKMYEDEKYNEYMQNLCKKSIYLLNLKLNEMN
ncbi:conserved Plasmodium protein, unknown function [Plasmodium gallinaceum]|uniref:KIF-binding protein n=1 Tax=Plasmodium gallinaceum TaxID=5849 RepID=A0A1J1GRE7_PLAGA|nr:conserved Plasmodium protein, unknown function [Plasmodium gallinaceum]CRG94994.1 conserved Plasmodium protein, unknown function [Plasmodium gallinaceum]